MQTRPAGRGKFFSRSDGRNREGQGPFGKSLGSLRRSSLPADRRFRDFFFPAGERRRLFANDVSSLPRASALSLSPCSTFAPSNTPRSRPFNLRRRQETGSLGRPRKPRGALRRRQEDLRGDIYYCNRRITGRRPFVRSFFRTSCVRRKRSSAMKLLRVPLRAFLPRSYRAT